MQEIRSLSAGLVIPDLNDLCTDSAIQKVIDRHEKRTSSTVQRHLTKLPSSLGLSSKICIYRFIQEGLNNAFRHGKCKRFKVRTREYIDSGLLFFEVKLKGLRGQTEKHRIASKYFFPSDKNQASEEMFKILLRGKFNRTG